MRSLNTPHTRRGLAYLIVGLCVALALWELDVPPLGIGVVVGGILLFILVGIASGLYFGDAEGT